jgi:hypothetical protein
MKATHRPDIWTFAVFDPARDVDFNGWLLVREGGNVLVDPVAMSEHDREHLARLGGAAWIAVTNSDHVRAAGELARELGAKLAGPAAERDGFPLRCDAWLGRGETWVAGIEVIELDGSKTPGELALVVDGDTLVVGDLVRAHTGGRLGILPDAKLRDRAAAVASVRMLADRAGIAAVLVGDGWPVFRDGGARLRELADSLS